MNEIIDTQDGNCIWQTLVPINGRVRAFIRPAKDGIKNWVVLRKEEDGSLKSFGLFESEKVALINADMFKGTVLPVTSGKFP
jgi:hypothetical protein